MKKYFTLSIVGAMLALFAATTLAEVAAPQSFGITNASLADSAGATALGQSEVRIEGQDKASLILRGGCNGTNIATTFRVELARVDGNGVVETSPRIIWQPPCGTASSNNIVCWTNLPSEVIGGARGLALISLTNVSGGATFSPALYLQKKTIKAAP